MNNERLTWRVWYWAGVVWAVVMSFFVAMLAASLFVYGIIGVMKFVAPLFARLLS